MRTLTASDAAKAVVRRNTEEVQGKGNFDVFEELFADDFFDHTPQPNMTPDRSGALQDLSRNAHGNIPWYSAHGQKNTVRDRRRDARAQRQDQGALGRGKPLLAYAATRRFDRDCC